MAGDKPSMNDPLDHVIAEITRAALERTATARPQSPAGANGHHPDTPPRRADVTCPELPS
jgi:hypothetical protein